MKIKASLLFYNAYLYLSWPFSPVFPVPFSWQRGTAMTEPGVEPAWPTLPLCLWSTELQTVAASPFQRTLEGQLPCHALCPHSSPVGKLHQRSMPDHSLQTSPHSSIALWMPPEAPGPGSYFFLYGKGHLATQLCHPVPPLGKHREVLVLCCSHGWAGTPSWGAIRDSIYIQYSVYTPSIYPSMHTYILYIYINICSL